MLTLEELSAIEEIKQLKAKYFRMMDSKNWTEWRTVFTDDMRLDVDQTVPDEQGNVVQSPAVCGGDNVVASVSTLLKDFTTVHHGHTFEITIESPSTASGIWAMEDIVKTPNGKLHGAGHYHEKYIKIEGQWYIQYSHLTRLYLDVSGSFMDDVAKTAYLT